MSSVQAAEDDASDFGLNVFTDLAPLLALFGDQFARQFMSESLLWLDHIVFAMAPLGVLSATVCAIRVAGPFWARAFIGRARESRASAEIDLMSSTSCEVGEVFDGNIILRVPGAPKLMHFLIISPCRDQDPTYGLHTLESAYNAGLLEKGKFGIWTRWERRETSGPELVHLDAVTEAIPPGINWQLLRRRRSTRELSTRKPNYDDLEGGQGQKPSRFDKSLSQLAKFPVELEQSPPNLQLNLPSNVTSHSRSIQELCWAAAAGVIIQLTVVAIASITTYHPATRNLIAGPVSQFGFPIFASGTSSLVIGMLLCSWVIGESTREHVFRVSTDRGPGTHPLKSRTCERTQGATTDHDNGNAHLEGRSGKSPDISNMSPGRGPPILNSAEEQDIRHAIHDKRELRVFWLQPKVTVNDQDLDPCLIVGGLKDEVLTSSRIPEISLVYQLLTVCDVILGLSGFVLQLQGLRGLTWPTAVSHLLSMIVMALIRAAIRRDLGEQPSTIVAQESHELDWLALRLVYEDYPLEPPKRSPSPQFKEPSTANPDEGEQSMYTWRVLCAGDMLSLRLYIQDGYLKSEDHVTRVMEHPATGIAAGHLKQPFPRNNQTVVKIR
ncbi:hypothetical protein BDV95DRAFT_612861 [Massariosphaeria phaeospora]|uniref:Uncharacterized protein n=1 Tax=Massariosphaeria phaeospora TaxID=100035 RepID=A0A7C8M1I9_9PLEO|nr:hypothetical protein BDV95DRAFT_612861 [Massariosphaeria phaeospora]